MPFEQRVVTYFVCKDCEHEYAILGNLEYSKIYECSQEGCAYQEPFLGLTPAISLSISSATGVEVKKSFFSKIWHNTLIQGILSGLITFIILGAITFFIANSLLANFKA